MTTMRDCVQHISKTIGARPAGSDEEQKASFYIEDLFNEETSYEAEIQEFAGATGHDLYRCVLVAVAIFCAILVMFLNMLAIPGFILSAAALALFALEELNIFSFAKYFGEVPTQNVVARPDDLDFEFDSHRRKVVLVANYDSGKIRPELKGAYLKYAGYAKILELSCLALIVILCFIHIFVGGNIVFNILFVLAIIGSALPIAKYLYSQSQELNESANYNAASVAVMIDIAKRMSTGVYRPVGDTPVIHGRREAEEGNYIPKDAQVTWKADAVDSEAAARVKDLFFGNNQNDAPSLENFDLDKWLGLDKSGNYVGQEEEFEAPGYGLAQDAFLRGEETPAANETKVAPAVEPIAPVEPTPENVPEPAAEEPKEDSNVPDWFKAGKAKAGNKGNTGLANVRPSKFDNAFENAVVQNAPESQTTDVAQSSDLQAKLDAIHSQIQANSDNALQNLHKDAGVAEHVLNAQEAEDAFATMPDMNANGETDDVPELMPLEADYGIEVDEYAKLDAGKTEPMAPVVVDNRQQQPAVGVSPSSQASAEVAPKRDIKLPSLTGALEAQKLNEQLKANEAKAAGNSNAERLAQLPSMTQVTTPAASTLDDNKIISNAGAFGVGDATGIFTPLTDGDLIAANEGEDLYVYDADDSSYQEAATEKGAIAGPGYVDIPDTHAESIFGKLFHKKKDREETSFSDSIGVDESWEARKVGKARGDWSSFMDDDDWNGGAVYAGGEGFDEPSAEEGADSSSMTGINTTARDEIYKFSTNDIQTEVWCVALGTELGVQEGIKNFLIENGQDLKGATFICLDGMGAGSFTLIEKDGMLLKSKLPSRMKRHVRSAANMAGVSLTSSEMTWQNSTASYLASKHKNVIHLARMKKGIPTLMCQKEDYYESVHEEDLKQSADFVMELIRSL